MTTKTKLTQRQADHAMVRRFLLVHFVQTGKGLTVKELADKGKLGWTASRVRRAIETDSGFAEGLHREDGEVECFSTDYPMMSTGRFRHVTIYMPNREALRAALQDAAELVEDLAAYANGLAYGFDDKEGAAILARTSDTAPFRRCAAAKALARPDAAPTRKEG